MSPSADRKQLHVPLSELVRTRREELNLSLRYIEKDTGIRTVYLERIEDGRYDQLPDTVYTKGYVKNYAEYLGFDTAQIMRLYTRERLKYEGHNATGSKRGGLGGPKPLEAHRFVFTPRLLVVAIGAAVVLTIFGYVFWQFAQLAVPPKITVTNPRDDVVAASSVVLAGQTEPGSELFINGSPVLIGVDGSFSEQVSLVAGANQITIRARNKLGKSSEVVKNITAQIPATAQQNVTDQLNATPVDGVQTVVSVSKQATWVSVQADGQDVFRGTMLPGSQRFFQAKQVIKLTTGNGGATSVIITNATTARRELGQVGRDGEAKLDLVFNRDTEFGQ